MNWLELAIKGVQGWAWVKRFQAWQKARDERLSRETADLKAREEQERREANVIKFTPPRIPPGAIVVLLALFLTSCASFQQRLAKDLADLQVYCCERPEECLELPTAFQCTAPTPTPYPTMRPCTGPTETWCECDSRDGTRSSWVFRACPTPTPQPTMTPTPCPEGSHIADLRGLICVPDPEPTPTPTPVPPPDGCLAIESVPLLAVKPARAPCKRGFHPVGTSEGDLCFAYWKCEDGKEEYNCPTRMFLYLRGGGPGGVHMEDGWVADTDRPYFDAYCRNTDNRVNVKQPPREPSGRLPGAWERAGICRPVVCPPPTPQPTAAPTPRPGATPMPTAGPTPTSCSCLVICTVAFLGINDGPAPHLEVGGEARLDVTCRWAMFNGDGRGQPVDRGGGGGRMCQVASDPVDWSIVTPGGVNQNVFNDGYGMRLSNLQPGDYGVSVRPRAGAVNQEGETVVSCSWPHGNSVRDSIVFRVP